MTKEHQSETNSVSAKTYTVKEVALMLKISVRKAYLFCEETKDFKVIHIGRSVRVHKDSFDAWFGGE